MLILTRRIGESITIGNGIKVYVIDIKGRQVRLGIDAPTDTTIYREEIYQKILEENRLAAQVELTSFNHVKERKG
jgi:carbon storage regulator